MSFNNFRANVLVRVLILIALCLVLVWGFLNTSWVATPALCLGLIVVCGVELVHYVESTTPGIHQFLEFRGPP